MDPALSKFLRSSGVFFLDGALTGFITASVTAEPFSLPWLKVLGVASLMGGVTSWRRYVQSLQASIVVVAEEKVVAVGAGK